MQPSTHRHDIVNIAHVEYNWRIGNNSKLIFDVVKKDELLLEKCNEQLLTTYKNEKIARNDPYHVVYIVDVGENHWVTLVIVYRDEQFFAYYIDPLGHGVDREIMQHLKDNRIYCPCIEVQEMDLKQEPIWKTGLFAVKYANIICEQTSFTDRIFKCLKDTEPFTGKPSANYTRIKTKTDVEATLSDVRPDSDRKTVTFFGEKRKAFATFTVGFWDGHPAAIYIANHNNFTDWIKNLCAKRGIPVFARDDIEQQLLSTVQFTGNIGLIAAHIAYEVECCIKKTPDNIIFFKKALLRLKQGITNDIQKMGNKLNAIKKIQDKIEHCKYVIAKHSDHYLTRQPALRHPIGVKNTLSCAQANFLILFLESTALEDMEISRVLGNNLADFRKRIMDDTDERDFRIIDNIRSKNLFHRTGNTIIKCCHLRHFIRGSVTKAGLFEKMSSFLNQMVSRLKGQPIAGEIIKVRFFLNEKENVGANKTFKEIKQYLSETFLDFINTNYYDSEDRQKIVFELKVNIVSMLDCLNDKRGSTLLEIEEFKPLKRIRNELTHNFHTYPNEVVRKIVAKKYVDKMKPIFFKYVYSQRVQELLNGITENLEQQLRDSLSETLKQFHYDADEFFGGDLDFLQYIQNLEVSEEIPSRQSCLKNFITRYVKIMLFIDNEDEVQRRERLYPAMPLRYDKRQPKQQNLPETYDRPSYMRLFIYEQINFLKEVYMPNLQDEYISSEKICSQKLMKRCGVLKDIFNSIVNLYVKCTVNSSPVHEAELDQFTESIFETVQRIGKDLDISDVSDVLVILTIDSRKYYVTKRRFVENIIKIRDSLACQYRNVFNNAEKLFCDETFLSLLIHSNNNLSNEHWEMILGIKLLSPYVAELIIRDQITDRNGLVRRGLVKSDTLNRIIENLLENRTSALQINKLFTMDWSKLSFIFSPRNQISQNEGLSQEEYFRDFWSFVESGPKLIKLICQRLNVSNIRNASCLLNDKTYAIDILYELKETISTNNDSGQENTNLVSEILLLVWEISHEFYLEKDFNMLLKLMNVVKCYSNHLPQDSGSLIEHWDATLYDIHYDLEYCIG